MNDDWKYIQDPTIKTAAGITYDPVVDKTIPYNGSKQDLIEIDGTTASPVYWQGGTAPSQGNVSGVDSYLINITRRVDGGSGTAQYTVLASQTQFGKVDY